ncbi:Uncharacterised protein [Klebsiella pneumoniae]|nr:Uncharacterised protein [Klebsiella pneumoniae]
MVLSGTVHHAIFRVVVLCSRWSPVPARNVQPGTGHHRDILRQRPGNVIRTAPRLAHSHFSIIERGPVTGVTVRTATPAFKLTAIVYDTVKVAGTAGRSRCRNRAGDVLIIQLVVIKGVAVTIEFCRLQHRGHFNLRPVKGAFDGDTVGEKAFRVQRQNRHSGRALFRHFSDGVITVPCAAVYMTVLKTQRPPVLLFVNRPPFFLNLRYTMPPAVETLPGHGISVRLTGINHEIRGAKAIIDPGIALNRLFTDAVHIGWINEVQTSAAIIGRYVISCGDPKRQTGKNAVAGLSQAHKIIRCLVCTLIIGVRLRAVCQNDDRAPAYFQRILIPLRVINLALGYYVRPRPGRGCFPGKSPYALTAVVLRIEAVRLVSVRRISGRENLRGGANDIAEAENQLRTTLRAQIFTQVRVAD